MTDNEIVKALNNYLNDIRCAKCGFKDNYLLKVIEATTDLLNRLQADKQSLKYDYDNLQRQFDEIYQQFHYLSNVEIPYLYSFTEDKDKKLETIANILLRTKAKAYKECIEKVKTEIEQALENNYKVRAERIEKHNVGETDEFISYCGGKIDCLRGLDDFLDNLLKELVGDDNAEAI